MDTEEVLTATMNLDALSEEARCAVLTERLPKECGRGGMPLTERAGPGECLTAKSSIA